MMVHVSLYQKLVPSHWINICSPPLLIDIHLKVWKIKMVKKLKKSKIKITENDNWMSNILSTITPLPLRLIQNNLFKIIKIAIGSTSIMIFI